MRWICLIAFSLNTCLLSGPIFAASKAEEWFSEARKHYERQEWEPSRQAALKALGVNPQFADAEILLGLIATGQSQLEEAEKRFSRAAALQPRNDRALAYLASTYLQQTRLAEAGQTFRKALQLNPRNAAAQYNLGLIGLLQAKPAEALSFFEKALAIDTSDVAALAGILECQVLLKHQVPAQASLQRLQAVTHATDARLLRVAMMLLRHRQYAMAIPVLERIRAAFPASYEANYNLALAYLRNGEFERTSGFLVTLLQTSPRAELFSLLAEAEKGQKRSAAALAAYRRATDLEPANETYRFDYANELLQQDQPFAEQAFVESIRDFPKSWKMRLGLGAARYLKGQYQAAAGTLLEAVGLAPREGLAYFLLGKLFESAPQVQGRILKAFEDYVATRPEDPWAYYHLGRMLRLQPDGKHPEKLEAAKAHLRTAIQRDPQLAEAYLELAILAQQEDQVGESISLLEKAIEKNPSLAGAHYRLAQVYGRLGQKEKSRLALERFEKVRSNDPTQQETQAIFRKLAGKEE